MKYLNKYVDFKESFDISSTDAPDEKLAKEEINSTEENLKEYKEKKSMIEQIFSSGKDASEIDTELKKLIPETDNSNSFLTDFIKICTVQKEIEDGKSSSEEDNNKIKLFSTQKKLSAGDKVSTIGSKISQIADRIKNFAKILTQKSQELTNLMSEHKEKISQVEQELNQSTKEIKSE
jgi:hypothetical protein